MDIVIAHSFEDFVSLQSGWEKLSKLEPHNKDYYLSFSWFYGLLTSSDNPSENLHILSIYDDKELVAIFPFCINIKTYRGTKFKFLEFLGNTYSPLRGGVYLKEKENDIASCVVEYILKDNRAWDILNLTDLSKNDSLLTLITNIISTNTRAKIYSDASSNIVSDISSFNESESYFKSLSKKLRQTIRTGLNRAHKDSNLNIHLTENTHEDIDLVMDHYYEVYNNSWKIQEGDSAFHRKLAHHLANQGKLRIFMLYSHEKTEQDIPPLSWDSEITLKGPATSSHTPVAAIFMIVHDNTAYYLKTSYRESHAKLSVGMILFWHAVKYLIDTDKVKCIDHQKGADPYKLKWGNLHEIRYNYLMANPYNLKAKLLIIFDTHIVPKLKILRKLITTNNKS